MLIAELLDLFQMTLALRNIARDRIHANHPPVQHNRHINHAYLNGMSIPVNQPAFKSLGSPTGSRSKARLHKFQFLRIHQLAERRVMQTLPGIAGQMLQAGVQRLNAAV
ncbi:hypothetical protein D3C73_1084910 [compost metagenome]